MTRSPEPTLYLTRSGTGYYVVPGTDPLAAGELVVVTVHGDERHVDANAIAPYAVSAADAGAHLRAQVATAVAAAVDAIGGTLDLHGPGSGVRRDLHWVAEKLGVSEADLRVDPAAARELLHRFAADVHAVSSAVTSGDADGLRAARDRLAARGIDVGDSLDELPGYLRAIQQLDLQRATDAAATGLRALADTAAGEPATPLGRRLDELVERLERELGPLVGIDRERERRVRQEEYRQSARSAIADSLRAAGITPLASVEPATGERPDPTR